MVKTFCTKILCYDLAKWLSHYLYFFSFLFLFLFSSYLDLLHKKGVWESITWQMLYIIVICQDITVSHHIIELHDKCGKVVYRPYSSCISSIWNLIRTLLSSSCQLRLGVWLSYLRLSHYNRLVNTTNSLYERRQSTVCSSEWKGKKQVQKLLDSTKISSIVPKVPTPFSL